MIGLRSQAKRRAKPAETRPGLYAALDVGSSKTVCVIAKVEAPKSDGAKPRIRALGVGHHESAGVRQGQIVEIERVEDCVRQAVQKAESMADLRIDDVWISVTCGRPESRVVRAETPVNGGEVADGDVRRVHALARAAFDAQEKDVDRAPIYAAPLGYVLDAAGGVRDPRGMFGERLGVSLHLLTVAAAPLHNLEACVERCHLEVKGRALSAYAAGLACLHEEELEYGATVVDMGGGTTSVAAFAEGRLTYASVIPIGGKHVTNDIVRGLSTPFREAERLKTLYGNALPVPGSHGQIIGVSQIGDEHGAESGKIPREELINIIQPRIDETFELVRERIAASRAASNVVVLTGGASELMGLQEYAGRALGKRVRIGRPLKLDGAPANFAGPAFAAAAGLLTIAQSGGDRDGEVAPSILRSSRQTPPLGRIGAWLRETFL